MSATLPRRLTPAQGFVENVMAATERLRADLAGEPDADERFMATVRDIERRAS